ncbi:DUF2637 domain-containing protein [Streptomyces sp. RKAG337]|uniref:DUF2637 domain-containing protein n=1 Tax=Streptomyces sp. RKAG337 TaxID=2893404 RepID=UPI002033816E|nr:DUF2637 domain-containing protein [Streptomyces sp. RKAG337]MCM2431053.1 DUF2637 domain-containing protein [Streptomyces sp. RKAG337]
MTAGSSSTVLQPHAPNDPAPGRTKVQWTRGRKALFGAIGLGSIAIAAAGFTGSYTAVRSLAEEKGFGSFAPAFPLAVDMGIAVLLALDLALTSVNLKYPLLRYIAWLLTAATITFNAASSWPDVLGSAMHATIPLLFISVTEAMRNAIAKATAIEFDQHMDSIRLARWILSPASTFSIWRDMKLWEIRSYSLALERYQEKMLLRQDLRAEYGRRWRKKATGPQMRPLRQARLGIAIDRGAGAPVAAEQQREDVPAARSTTAEPPAQLSPPSVEIPSIAPAPVLPTVALAPEPPIQPAPAPAPEPQVPPTAREEFPESEPELELPQPRAQPVQEQVLGPDAEPRADEALAPAASGASTFEVVEDRGEEFDAEDNETAEGEMEEPKVDLGVAPPNETKVQRAERIYLAHHQAGVELTKPNLARWAGYQQEGSGRTQYNKLEKKYGPIVIREGADQLDLNWPAQPDGRGVGLRPVESAR